MGATQPAEVADFKGSCQMSQAQRPPPSVLFTVRHDAQPPRLVVFCAPLRPVLWPSLLRRQGRGSSTHSGLFASSSRVRR